MPINILLVTYEYDAFTFSGNGIYAQSLVRGLQMQEGVTVTVVCGGPFGAENAKSKAAIVVSLPRWGCLDGSSAYREFAAQMNEKLDEHYKTHEWPDLMLGIDWHCLPIFDHLAAQRPLVMVYLNFRVFSRSGSDFMKSKEFSCMERAWLTLALSETDAAFLRELNPYPDVAVLLPPLRQDVVDLATKKKAPKDQPKRTLITCCVRLSDEKQPERFVELVEHLAERKAFDGIHGFEPGLRPVLVTGRMDVEMPLVQRFLNAHPSADAYPFLDAKGLEELYSKTLLCVHPPSYDAFGMSAIEAAAFGAPTMFMKDADVGAKHVLSFLGDEAYFEADLDDNHTGYIPPEDRATAAALEAMSGGELKRYRRQYEDGVFHVLKVIRNNEKLRAVGNLAKKRAITWTEQAHGDRLIDHLVPILSEAKEAKRQLAMNQEQKAGLRAPPPRATVQAPSYRYPTSKSGRVFENLNANP